MAAVDNLNNLVQQIQGVFQGTNTKDRPRVLNRFSGGSARTNQAFVTGYFAVALKPPTAVFQGNEQDVEKWFHATCESFTPPSISVLKSDIPGMGGQSSSVATGIEISRTFTLAFREYQGLPIIRALKAWASVIDPHSGFSPLPDFIPANYKGVCVVAAIKPLLKQGATVIDSSVVEEAWVFDGVFPETIPWDSMSFDISAPDTIQVSTTFSFDGSPLTLEFPVVKNIVDTAFAGYDFSEFVTNHIDNVQMPY